jgi:hypothetical protein
MAAFQARLVFSLSRLSGVSAAAVAAATKWSACASQSVSLPQSV